MASIRSAVIVASLLLLNGCAFTLAGIDTGASAGRTFEDGKVFDSGKTAWNCTVTGHWVRDKR